VYVGGRDARNGAAMVVVFAPDGTLIRFWSGAFTPGRRLHVSRCPLRSTRQSASCGCTMVSSTSMCSHW
jgi:hypothetical protein